MHLQERIDNYVRETKFPRSLFISEDGRVVGTWVMGNDYRVKSSYYGGYPAGYLRRIKALFPEKQFSGRVDVVTVPGDTVDINPDLNPTFVDDAKTLDKVPLENYDLILADAPYSVEDAERYQTTMVKRNCVMRALQRVTPGTHIVWLDQVLPMYRKDAFAIDAVIGMVKSTNHRFRVVTIFRRLHTGANSPRRCRHERQRICPGRQRLLCRTPVARARAAGCGELPWCHALSGLWYGHHPQVFHTRGLQCDGTDIVDRGFGSVADSSPLPIRSTTSSAIRMAGDQLRSIPELKEQQP